MFVGDSICVLIKGIQESQRSISVSRGDISLAFGNEEKKLK
jgi:hypothetical protein